MLKCFKQFFQGIYSNQITRIVSLCALLPVVVFSQPNKIVPAAPNAMKMTEYHAQRPNMYTGTANISIPLHSINFDGWDLPLSLSYNATGIRPNEEAGEVGLGWVLNATGTISRTIRGSDDLFQGNNSTPTKGYVYNERPINAANVGNNFDLGYDRSLSSIPPPGGYFEYVATQNPDTQPDIFNYNFFGYSGSFTLSQKVLDGTVKVLKISQDACKLNFNEGNRTFIVITPQGYKGEFTVHEKSTTFSGSMVTNDRTKCCGYNANGHDMTAIKNSGRLRTITTWYLSKITSPRGQEIMFKYDLRFAANDGITYDPPYVNGEVYSPYISNTRSFGELENVQSLETCIQTVHEHVYLDSIVSPDVKIKFLTETREDLRRNYFFAPDSGGNVAKVFHRSENLKRYNGIVVKGKDPVSTLNKVITLKQRYFNQQFQDQFADNQNEKELRWLRSRLDKVTIDDQEYQFYYEKGAKGLPNKLTRGIDHFGFYNGQDQVLRLLPPSPATSTCILANKNDVVEYSQLSERMVDFSYGIAGILSKVKYPTRGWTSFEYEPHTYLPDATLAFREAPGQKSAGGARIKTIKEYDYTNDQVPVLTKSYRYTEGSENSPATPTTGKLMTPLYNRYVKDLHDSNQPPTYPIVGCEFFFQTYANIPGNNSAEGRVIGYSRVHEVVIGGATNYKNTFDFENIPNTVNPAGGGWNLYAYGKPNLNGQLIKSRNYNSYGQIVQHIANDDREHNFGDIPSITYVNAYNTNGQVSPFYIYHTYSPIKQVFNTPYKITTTVASSPSNLVEDASGNLLTLGNSTQTVTDLVYNAFNTNDNFLLRSQQTINSKNELILKEIKRPSDYGAPSTALSYMKDPNVNMIEPVIEEITKLNGTVVSASGNRYELENGRVNLKATYTYNSVNGFSGSYDGFSFVGGYELSEEFSNYDPVSGRLMQYTDRSRVVNSFIWGYNNQLPIVHGVGITSGQLSTAHSAALAVGGWGTNAYETSLRNHANTVGKQVTTFVHNPQVGVTKITDGNGTTKSFQYDGYNRLQKVVDKDGFTTDQYQYHFRERQPTRVLSVSGNLNFGVLTPDMFAAQFDPSYIRCSDHLRTKVLTLTNDGEDDLQINSITVSPPTSAFSLSWQTGEIAPGTSIDVILSFNSGVQLANYSGTVVISSNRTNVNNIDIPISANYANRVPGVSFSPVTGSNPGILDLGTVTGLVAGQYLDVTNNSNAPFRIVGLPLGWNGTDTNYGNYTNPDFSVSYSYGGQIASGERVYGQCISVGQTVRVPVTFNPTPGGPNGIRSAKLSLVTDVPTNVWSPTLYQNAVTMQANLQRPISTISMNVNTITLGNFTQPSVTTPVTITNTGNLGFTVSGLSFSNPSAAQHFSITPQLPFPFVVNPNQSVLINIKFQPLQFDLNLATDIVVNNDAMNPVGNETIAFTGNRSSYRKMALSTELTNNELLFDNVNEAKTVTITNQGNDNLSIDNFEPANASLQYFQVTSFTPSLLAPGQSVNMQVFRTSSSANVETITIGSNKNDGVNSFVARGKTRVIGLAPTSISFAPFSGASISQEVVVSNTGTAPLTVNGVSSSNSMFSVSPAGPYAIPPGGQQNVTVTFTPDAFNFSQQNATLTFNANQTSGTTSINVSGQRSSVRTIELSANSLNFNTTGQQQSVTISNGGNDYLNITGVDYANTPNWYVTITPANLAPGQNTTLNITRLNGANPETLNISVVSNKTIGNEVVQVTANTRNISLSGVNFPSFTGSSVSQTMTVFNYGNTTLTVSSISSSNAMFTVSPSSFTVAPNNGQQTVTVTYTPVDFSSQSATLTFNCDATSGTNFVTTTPIQRTQKCELTFSPNNLTVYGFSTVTGYIINTGNVNYTTSSVAVNGSGVNTLFTVKFFDAFGQVTNFSNYTVAPNATLIVELKKISSGTGSGSVRFFTSTGGCPSYDPAISLGIN